MSFKQCFFILIFVFYPCMVTNNDITITDNNSNCEHNNSSSDSTECVSFEAVKPQVDISTNFTLPSPGPGPSGENEFIAIFAEVSTLTTDLPVNYFNLSWRGFYDIDDVNEELANKSIHSLDLSGNLMTEIDALSSKTVQELILRHGYLHYIKGLTNLTALHTLDSSHNIYLTSFEPNNPTLSSVDISYAAVAKFSLQSLPNITLFNASHCRITYIREETFAFNILLENLDLSDNDIEYIEDYSFIRNVKLKYLNLAQNKLVNIDWASTLKSVQLVNLSSNAVYDINLLFLRNVSVLDLSNNKIENIPEDLERLLPNLKSFDVHLNSIRVVKKVMSSSLEHLNLHDCKIQSIESDAFSTASNLKYIDLSDNKLQHLDFVLSYSNQGEILLHGNLWNCNCSWNIRVDVECFPLGLRYGNYCEILANATLSSYEPWFLKAANPVFWAPPLFALAILVGGLIILGVYRNRKRSSEKREMDLVKNIKEESISIFDDDEIKKLLSKRLSTNRLQRKLSFISESGSNDV